MNKLTTTPFIASISLFGIIAFVVVFASSALSAKVLIGSDDPYILAFAFSCIITLAGFIFFTLKEINLRWLKPTPSILAYYLLLIIYAFLIEYNGGEGAGIGYVFIFGVIVLTPILFIFICYSNNSKLLLLGFLSGLIYLIGYLNCCS